MGRMQRLREECSGTSVFQERILQLQRDRRAWIENVAECKKAAQAYQKQDASPLFRRMVAATSPLNLWEGGRWEEAMNELVDAEDLDKVATYRTAVVTFNVWAEYSLRTRKFREPDVEFIGMKYTDGEKEDLEGDIANRDEFDPEDYIDWVRMKETLGGDQDGLGMDTVELELFVFVANKPEEEQ